MHIEKQKANIQDNPEEKHYESGMHHRISVFIINKC